jgi:large subunit ribosomal protein L19
MIMAANVMERIKREKLAEKVVPFSVGDTIRVHVKIHEGDKDRIQAFAGLVIGRRGGGATETFTVRRVSHGVGVERVFLLHSPQIAGIDVEGSGRVRRAKLYYLRDRAGKQAKLRARAEDTRGAPRVAATPASAAPAAPAATEGA